MRSKRRPNAPWPSSWYAADCTDCPRLSRHLAAAREEHPGYHNLPVSPFGDRAARLLVIGLAPGRHGANASGRVFTGDYAGALLYRTLHRFGFATRPESVHGGDGLELVDCRITNAVKCLPPENKPTADEVRRCNHYLASELAASGPGDVLVALGAIAHRATLLALELRPRDYPFTHAARYDVPGERVLLDSYHCSRYNTQTRRLTPEMFCQVFEKARALLG